MAFTNYYIVLGVKNTATFDEIKAAYRELAKKYHPDKNPGNTAAEDFFKEVQQAYAVLSNPEKRRKFDLKFSYGSSPKPNGPTQTTQSKHYTYTQYTGNAYQYAQQQAQSRQQGAPRPSKPKAKPDRSENHYILVSVGVALILLYFIISYSTQKTKFVPQIKAPRPTAVERKTQPENENQINAYDSPYTGFFGEEVNDFDSKSSITINNSENSEAVVCLVSTGKEHKTIRNQYMPPSSTFKMNNIPDGHYYLKVFFGNIWNARQPFLDGKVKGGFVADVDFVKMNTGKNALLMEQKQEGSSTSFSSYEITLDPYDTLAAQSITEKEFFE